MGLYTAAQLWAPAFGLGLRPVPAFVVFIENPGFIVFISRGLNIGFGHTG